MNMLTPSLLERLASDRASSGGSSNRYCPPRWLATAGLARSDGRSSTGSSPPSCRIQ